MRVLLDTNILGRLTNPKEPDYVIAMEACYRLTRRNDVLHITPQNIVEFDHSQHGHRMSTASVTQVMRPLPQ